VFVTRDGGARSASIASNLPTDGPDFVHVIREDPVNPNLLYVGTDVGVYCLAGPGAELAALDEWVPDRRRCTT
jgi:hypothetical protein